MEAAGDEVAVATAAAGGMAVAVVSSVGGRGLLASLIFKPEPLDEDATGVLG